MHVVPNMSICDVLPSFEKGTDILTACDLHLRCGEKHEKNGTIR